LSIQKDEFSITMIGNLIADPKLIEDEDGNKVCFCRIASNPRARKVDPKTGKAIPDEERNRLRTHADLKIRSSEAAEIFYQTFKKHDRVWIKGEGGTKKIPKMYWSEVDQQYTPCEVDVDSDGKNVQLVTEDRLVIRVRRFMPVSINVHTETERPRQHTNRA
jgi:hypothetical protein